MSRNNGQPVNITVNGRIVAAFEGEMLLTTLRREKIDIPALCQHDAVEPYGGCRMCMVEISKADWDSWTKQVTSCLYPVEADLIVNTHTTEIIELRKTLVDLYLARSPNSTYIRKLADEYGVANTSYETVEDGDDCILCAICTRICDKMGFFAISGVGRGHGKEIAPPLGDPPENCTGCLSCAINCPTDFIKTTRTESQLTIWGRTFDLMVCSQCGKSMITREFAEHLSKRRDIAMKYFEVCDACHRKELSSTMGRITNWQREPQK